MRDRAHVERYTNLKVKYIDHHNPDLVLLAKDGSETHRVDLTRLSSTHSIHKLCQLLGLSPTLLVRTVGHSDRMGGGHFGHADGVGDAAYHLDGAYELQRGATSNGRPMWKLDSDTVDREYAGGGVCGGTDGEFDKDALNGDADTGALGEWYTHTGLATGICDVKDVGVCGDICEAALAEGVAAG